MKTRTEYRLSENDPKKINTALLKEAMMDLVDLGRMGCNGMALAEIPVFRIEERPGGVYAVAVFAVCEPPELQKGIEMEPNEVMNEQAGSETAMTVEASGVDLTSLTEIMAIQEATNALKAKCEEAVLDIAGQISRMKQDCATCPVGRAEYSGQSIACMACSTGSGITVSEATLEYIGRGKGVAIAILALL